MNKTNTRIVLATIFFCIVFTSHSQTHGIDSIAGVSHTDTTRAGIVNNPIIQTPQTEALTLNKTSPIRGMEYVVGANLAVWGFDRFVLRTEYSKINFNTIKNNFNTGFEWDNDMFSTNLLLHPYHGGLYFNAARSNGRSFWRSIPITSAGSLMWEFFMENESPSINDFAATTFGGAALGEITYRLSDLLIDDRLTGFSRFRQEAFITLVSPIRGLNRIITGDAWVHRDTKGNSMPSHPLVFSIWGGHRIIADRLRHHQDYSNMLSYDIGLKYGNEFDPDNEKPYDFFEFYLSGNFFSNQPLVSRVNVMGMIASKNVPLKKKKHSFSYGLYQHFNYYVSKMDNKHELLYPYKISEAASAGPGMLYSNSVSNKLLFAGEFYLSCILLGGAQTDYYRFDERDYNLGSGYSSKLNLSLTFHKNAQIYLNSEDYRIYSWLGFSPDDDFSSNVHGDIGKSSLSVARLGARIHFTKKAFFSLETAYYIRRSFYKFYPDITHQVAENKVSVGVVF